jgi:hypothetical protein
MTTESIKLADALPDLTAELDELLKTEGLPDLCQELPNLVIHDRCRCGDDFCASFYTALRQAPFGPDHYTIALLPMDGMINIDVAGGKIVQIEVLYRDDVRGALHGVLP